MWVLEIWSKFKKIWLCKELDKRRESFLPNTHNFLAFFIVFEMGRIWKVQWILFFCECFRTSCCISPRNLKNPTIPGKIRGKFCITFHFLVYIALSKILPHSKTIKNAKKLWVFGKKTTLVVYLIFYKVIFF